MTKQDDGLFLLEALVDKIVFIKSPCFSDKDFRTCVNIECPAVPPLEICDDEPGACIAKSSGPFVKTFNNGKSCLFSLKESDISSAMSKFPVQVSVYKSLPCGCLPTKIIMGKCTIDMTKEFVEARKTFLEDPTSVSYQALKDSFRIIGPDSSETGEIVMFLRISCFGKLIITRFQGPGGPPNIGAGGGSSVVDRSCAPRKEYQTMQDPCACGAARGGGGGKGYSGAQPCNAGGGSGVCPPVKDPYNSMPCEDPDDPCYCSGPKPVPQQQLACRNTDQYCLHIPKGTLQRLPFYQDLTDEQKSEIKYSSTGKFRYSNKNQTQHIFSSSNSNLTKSSVYSNMNMLGNSMKKTSNIFAKNYIPPKFESMSSIHNSEIKHTISFLNAMNYAWDSYVSSIGLPIQDINTKNNGVFGMKETSVYMTLSDYFGYRRTSGTQATASINKCLQVVREINPRPPSTLGSSSIYFPSSCTMSTLPYQGNKRGIPENLINPEVYFFGRKKEETKKGMGSSGSKTKLQRTNQSTSTGARRTASKTSLREGSSTTIKKNSSTTTNPRLKPSLPSKQSKGASTTTGSTKTVTIRDDKSQKPCPALGITKGDMMVTVSHIRIGPKESCPVHGSEPCQGPKCILASSGEEQGAVKVTTVNNPRRGVFEVVIRRLTGAPLAKNELMLEWTPPPSRPPPCSGPCPMPCALPGHCRPSKCKLIVCRPSPCRPKCTRKKPCGPLTCKSPCRTCCKPPPCCAKPCRPFPPSPCGRCPPPSCKNPCISPCGVPACSSPCKSSPCLRSCPVGRKRPRKSRSQPRIKSHKKRISPCCNRSKTCPVVRCRSVPCRGCCSVPPFCLPRKCCSVVPCKPPKSCISSCSSCCG